MGYAHPDVVAGWLGHILSFLWGIHTTTLLQLGILLLQADTLLALLQTFFGASQVRVSANKRINVRKLVETRARELDASVSDQDTKDKLRLLGVPVGTTALGWISQLYNKVENWCKVIPSISQIEIEEEEEDFALFVVVNAHKPCWVRLFPSLCASPVFADMDLKEIVPVVQSILDRRADDKSISPTVWKRLGRLLEKAEVQDKHVEHLMSRLSILSQGAPSLSRSSSPASVEAMDSSDESHSSSPSASSSSPATPPPQNSPSVENESEDSYDSDPFLDRDEERRLRAKEHRIRTHKVQWQTKSAKSSGDIQEIVISEDEAEVAGVDDDVVEITTNQMDRSVDAPLGIVPRIARPIRSKAPPLSALAPPPGVVQAPTVVDSNPPPSTIVDSLMVEEDTSSVNKEQEDAPAGCILIDICPKGASPKFTLNVSPSTILGLGIPFPNLVIDPVVVTDLVKEMLLLERAGNDIKVLDCTARDSNGAIYDLEGVPFEDFEGPFDSKWITKVSMKHSKDNLWIAKTHTQGYVIFMGAVKRPGRQQRPWVHLPWTPAGALLLQWCVVNKLVHPTQLHRCNLILRLQIPGCTTTTHHDYNAYGPVVLQTTLPVEGLQFKGKRITQYASELVFFNKKAWMLDAEGNLHDDLQKLNPASLEDLKGAAKKNLCSVVSHPDSDCRMAAFYGTIRKNQDWVHGTVTVPPASQGYFPVRLSVTLRPQTEFSL